MKLLQCLRCGENLREEGDLLKCDHCGATYEREPAEEASSRLADALGEAKLELLANRKRLLWDAAHEKYPSKERVVEAANAVLSVSAEDFLARIYLHSHDRDPLKLNAILASSQVDPSQAVEAFRWLLPSLSSRTVGPLHDFVDRHFTGKERFEKATAIESEASKISQGIYEPGLPRDVFLCYSSKDMERVVGLLDLLEQNGFACFAAFRNIRHGKGAQGDYLPAIQTAMRSCETLVFVSSEASRSMDCDALRVELPYLIQELPDKPRIEFVIEDYGDTPFMVRRTLKRAFPSQEHCLDEEDLMERVQNAIDQKSAKKDDEAERLRKELEEERSRRKELEEARERILAEEMAKKEAEEKVKKEAEERAKKEAEEKARREAEEALRKEAEEKVREDLLREKMEKEARERILAEERARREPEARARFVPTVYGKYVYFGEYPQSEVRDPGLVGRLKFQQLAEGIVALDGKRYALAKDRYFLFEPIKWRILKKEGHEALLLSDALLDARLFSAKSNNYANSEVRAWLNGEFLKMAFPNGGEHIIASSVDNSASTTESSSNPYACEDTSDRVFLLSYRDYENADYGFTDNASRCSAPTDYAVAKGAYKNSSNGNDYYWTRSPRSGSLYGAWCVRADGGRDGDGVNNYGIGVRPCLRVRVAE